MLLIRSFCFSILFVYSTICYSFDGSYTRIRRQSDTPPCTTFKGENGFCINIKKCEGLYNALRSADSENINYVRQLVCGSENGAAKVCCPSTTATAAAPVQPSTPVRPPPNPGVIRPSSNPGRPISPTSNRGIIRNPVNLPPGVNVSPTTTTSSPDLKSNFEEGYQEICGKPTTTDVINADKIVGAIRRSVPGNWPWMVSLQYREIGAPANTVPAHRCGGTLISKRYVLTAAHCFTSRRFQVVSVRIGDLDLDSKVVDGVSPINVPVGQVITHPHYVTSPRQVNDIALIRLNRSVEYTPQIRPACLLHGSRYLSEEYYHRKSPFVIGWGDTSFKGANSSWLLETRLDMVNISTCRQNYENYKDAAIDERVLCASKQGSDSCQGDSGGPLLFIDVTPNGEIIYYLGGVVSYGRGCAEPNFPGVYTRVASYIDWISQVTKLKF